MSDSMPRWLGVTRRRGARPVGLLLGALALLLAAAGAASAYSFFYAQALHDELEDRLGEKVMVVDELVRIWRYQDVDGYLRFDTKRFRCAIPNTETESIAYLREVAERRAEGDTRRPLVALFGTVSRPPLWGEVRDGERFGVQSEQIVILCDRVEEPRRRFWEEGN